MAWQRVKKSKVKNKMIKGKGTHPHLLTAYVAWKRVEEKQKVKIFVFVLYWFFDKVCYVPVFYQLY
jgi:hypothetical protein